MTVDTSNVMHRK